MLGGVVNLDTLNSFINKVIVIALGPQRKTSVEIYTKATWLSCQNVPTPQINRAREARAAELRQKSPKFRKTAVIQQLSKIKEGPQMPLI